MLMTLIHRQKAPALAMALAAMMSASCANEFTRQGKSPAFLIVDSITAESGADPGKKSAFLLSDVQTFVEQTINGQKVRFATVFNDSGSVVLRAAMKNPGSATSPSSPTPINDITVSRYHVRFRRADGREQEGVNVPYAFDGAITATIGTQSPATIGFDLVRHTAKLEPPLSNLAGSSLSGGLQGGFEISTIAEITFYGRDQAGNDVSVTATIGVNFADFADPT
jgi:hypothetical protein